MPEKATTVAQRSESASVLGTGHQTSSRNDLMIIPEAAEVMLLCYQLLISSDDCIVIGWFSASRQGKI
jgi:hypothetical protein